MNEQPENLEDLEVDTLHARRVVLSGSDRQPRLILSVDEDGLASMSIADLSGRTRFLLTVGPSGETGLSFLDRNGKSRLSLSLTAFPFAQLNGPDGSDGLAVAVLPDGSPHVVTPQSPQPVPAE